LLKLDPQHQPLFVPPGRKSRTPEGEQMNLVRFFLAVGFLSVVASVARADMLVLKNGDHLTGTIVSSDGKELTLKTDFAGDIKVKWPAIADVKSDKTLYVVITDKKTVSGKITTEGPNLVVNTPGAGAVTLPMANATIIRSQEGETAYEKSQNPGILESWKGGANVGFALARGNSETTNLTTGFTADRKTLHDEVAMYFSSLYSSNNLPGGGVTANSILGGLRYDRNLTKRIFLFGAADYTHDQLQGLNLRSIYSVGPGYHLINTPETTLDLLVGVNYTRETFSGERINGAGVGTVERNLVGITTGENFMHKFGKSTIVTEHFYFYPDLTNTGQYRFALDGASVTKINRWLGLQLTVSDRYVSNPPIVGTKANDVIFSTGFNFAFTH
jgi:putative salt-induced outer membrane protein YdiY